MTTRLRGFGFGRYTATFSVEIVDRLDSSTTIPIDLEDAASKNSHSDRDSGETGHGTPRIAIAVMGQASTFSRWHQILSEQQAMQSKEQLSFIYGAYDKPVSDEGMQRCAEQVRFHSCHAEYIPNTTWTQGRNMLARHILKIEEQKNWEFDFWIFADDDLMLVLDDATSKKKSEGELWQNVLDQLNQAFLLPTRSISQFTAYRAKSNTLSQGGWVGVSTYDANLAVFSRWAVPYLLPYTTPLPGDSEWISQAALFCVTQTCFPKSVAVFPDIVSYNSLHREYPKERFTPEAIRAAVQENVGPYLDLNQFCTHTDKRQFQGPTSKFPSVAELEKVLLSSPKRSGLCEPLAVRFHDWERGTLMP